MTEDCQTPLPALEVDPEAAAEVDRHGGSLYVWADGAGMKHTGYQPPRRGATREWTRLAAVGIEVFVDQGILAPAKWSIALRHVPYRHVTALYNGYVPGATGIGMTAPRNVDL